MSQSIVAWEYSSRRSRIAIRSTAPHFLAGLTQLTLAVELLHQLCRTAVAAGDCPHQLLALRTEVVVPLGVLAHRPREPIERRLIGRKCFDQKILLFLGNGNHKNSVLFNRFLDGLLFPSYITKFEPPKTPDSKREFWGSI